MRRPKMRKRTKYGRKLRLLSRGVASISDGELLDWKNHLEFTDPLAIGVIEGNPRYNLTIETELLQLVCFPAETPKKEDTFSRADVNAIMFSLSRVSRLSNRCPRRRPLFAVEFMFTVVSMRRGIRPDCVWQRASGTLMLP